MNIIYIKSKIEEKIIEEPKILSIFRGGSYLFCENCKDYDYIVIIDNCCKSFKFYDYETKNDYFVHSKDYYDELLNFKVMNNDGMYILCDLFKPQYTLYGDSTTNLDLLGRKDEYKAMLSKVLPHSFLNPKLKWKDSDKYCHKYLWWAILGLLIIENESYEVTKEMKEIIQKCHDRILDKTWENWVKDRIQIKYYLG